jgi:hypothetical protein
MPAYNVHPKNPDSWSRGQIFRTTIIFLEIVVLLTVALLYTNQGSAVPTTADVAIQPVVVVNLNNTTDNLIPTTVYVSSSYRVFVVQNGVQHLAGVLDECDNRYIEAEFDGTLTNLHDAAVMYPTSAVHAAAFLANQYKVAATGTRIDIVLDTGAIYTVTLHCNGEFGTESRNAQDDSSGLEDLIGEAQRYDYDYGMGCPGGGH